MRIYVHLAFFILVTVLARAQPRYVVEGRFSPAAQGTVTVSAATSPFTTSALSDQGGRFRIGKLEEGTYTLSVFVPGRGELRRTVVLTPSTADKKRRLRLELAMDEVSLERDAAMGVSVRVLSISAKAKRQFDEAMKALSRNDATGAQAKLMEAVELSPQFGEAWNYLGTIAYQTQRYPRAEEMFRKALETDSQLYPPLVNLGGVLINLMRFDEAERFNRHAVLRTPGDALAHSQLGMTLLYLGKLDAAEESLREAIRLDEAHFSHPQVHLAEVLLRQGKTQETADMLEAFLRVQPDTAGAESIRGKIAELRNLTR